MITRSLHFLWKATILPIKLLFETGELTFRAGVKVGGLPVRGSRAAVRAVGWKITLGVVVGLVAGFAIGREAERRLHALHHHDEHDHDHGDAADAIEGAA